MPEAMPLEAFLEEARRLKLKFDVASNFEEMHQLWRSNALPYRFAQGSPHSEEYKSAVRDVYRKLTALEYSTGNEIVSTKQSAEHFEIGYPWISKNLGVISNEFIKIAQVLAAIGEKGLAGKRFIEFGAGWANLAIALARSGQAVTIVDIDDAFLTRARRMAERENLAFDTINGDFNEVAGSLSRQFDVAMFQASFHHCLEFDRLIDNLREHTLSETGSILFFAEPIYKDYTFPWGLRGDGESLWAIMCNKWLELGFDEDFFVELILRKGFLLSRIRARPGLMSDGWCADAGPKGLAFSEWEMPGSHGQSFHPSGEGEPYRFCREAGTLPGLAGCRLQRYRLAFYNFLPRTLALEVRGSDGPHRKALEPSETWTVEVAADCESVAIVSEAHSADALIGNGDSRTLGAALMSVGLAS